VTSEKLKRLDGSVAPRHLRSDFYIAFLGQDREPSVTAGKLLLPTTVVSSNNVSAESANLRKIKI
jgi:hypothetical protein